MQGLDLQELLMAKLNKTSLTLCCLVYPTPEQKVGVKFFFGMSNEYFTVVF